MQDLTGTAGQAYKDANRRYAIMARAEEMAKDRMGAAQSNRMMSLTDYIAAGTGAVSGGATGAVALGAANKMMRRYGSSTSAVGANELAKLLEASPESLKQFGSILKNAASQGNMSLGVTHYMLHQMNPEYRQTIDEATGGRGK